MTLTDREINEHRAEVVRVLLNHEAAISDRQMKRTATFWPDESDIWTETVRRLDLLYLGRSDLPERDVPDYELVADE